LSRWRVGRRAAVQHIPTYVLAKPIDGCVTPNPLRHRNSRTDRTRVTFSFRRKGERADRRILAGPTMWQNERFVFVKLHLCWSASTSNRQFKAHTVPHLY
jgi:hypothetical protein